MHVALSALALLLAAYKSAEAAVGMFDDSVVWRPNTPEWEGAFRCGAVSRAAQSPLATKGPQLLAIAATPTPAVAAPQPHARVVGR